ncbi:arginine-tRNA protein transferase 1, DELAYED LEAF SENESCENCE 1 [Hibiscus trionum]|uniref:Arginyl-tRNA--protein transferase n=1 Tax=Hibiscus trionum TaxID=183268 RepID=A0A9W7LWY6_HIBTR|nr:arginine-tRNA protein transferase 1, DELAYED LEAF SENESCENCE 1 [Hibiscus trionum]
MKNEASSSNSREESWVVDCGRRRSSCGYCKSSGRTSISHGLWAHSLTVNDYQDLLDRGWRRSGCFLYKPEMERTCCPSYTIRLQASDFVPSKEHRRVYRRMQRFIDGMLEVSKPMELADDENASTHTSSSVNHLVSSSGNESFSCGNKRENKAEEFMLHLSNQIDKVVHGYIESGDFPSGIQFQKATVKMVSHAKRKLAVEGSEDLLYTSNIAFQIAATLKRTRSAERDGSQSQMSRHSAEEIDLCPKSIAKKLAFSLNQLANISSMSIRACNGHINFYSTAKSASLDRDVQIVALPEESGGGNQSSSAKKSSEHRQGQKRKLEIRLKRSNFDPEEYELYKRYQIKVHNDPPDHVTESSYKRFLVETPLFFFSPSADGMVPPCGFGSFHQQYMIDGKLVAVGVVDILPRCLSSKYLFWDPDYAFLSLGKYSALQEIDWVKENQTYCASLQYYYMGYYIHSCSKMRYKAAYYPSELLCPFRYQWVTFHLARPMLDKKKYAVLSDYASLQDGESSQSCNPESLMDLQHDGNGLEDSNDVFMGEDEQMIEIESDSSDDELEPETSGLGSGAIDDGDVTNVLVGLRGSRLRYKDLQRAFGPTERNYLETQLRSYQRVVGVELSERMVYSLSYNLS